jgi:hypothetical protein
MTAHEKETLYNMRVDIELLKHSDVTQQEDLNDIKKTLKNNSILLTTSLISILIALLGIIAIFLQK